VVAAERVEFRSDGLTLVGDLRAQPGGRRPGLVFTGPFTGTRDQVTGTYAAALAEAGYATLAFDHRSFGESGGCRAAMRIRRASCGTWRQRSPSSAVTGRWTRTRSARWASAWAAGMP